MTNGRIGRKNEGDTVRMNKVIVIGCPGSGKSTFARELHQKTGFLLCHLDMLYWNADRTTVDKEVFLSRLRTVIKEERWIIDGNYASTLEERMAACDTVFFLDYKTEVCLLGIRERRGKSRVDMPWIEQTEDMEFMQYVRGFHQAQRPEILKLLKKYKDKRIVVFEDREDAAEFLKGENI